MERSDVIGGSRQYGQRDIPYALTRGELRKRKESIRSISLTADVTTITTSANVTWIFGSDQFELVSAMPMTWDVGGWCAARWTDHLLWAGR